MRVVICALFVAMRSLHSASASRLGDGVRMLELIASRHGRHLRDEDTRRNPSAATIQSRSANASQNARQWRPSQTKTVAEQTRAAGLGWHIVKFNREDIGENMVNIGCDGTSAKNTYIPPDLAGIWWQDRNSMPAEQAMSYGNAKWDPGPEGCRKTTIPWYSQEERNAGIIKSPIHEGSLPCLGRITFFVYDHRNWAYKPYTLNEAMAQGAAVAKKMVFDGVCGGTSDYDIKLCTMTTEISSQKLYEAVDTLTNTVTHFPTEFYQVRVNEDMWVRFSGYRKARLAGKRGSDYLSMKMYYVKRLVGCSGQHTRYWDEFNAGGNQVDFQGPENDVFGNTLGKYTSTPSSKVPDKLWTRANKAIDQENGVVATSFYGWA